jgi:ribonuclease HI
MRLMEYVDERDLNIYIDGSSLSAPRRGGVGILFITEDPDGGWLETPYDLPGFASATNNQMEIQACIEALQAVIHRRVPFVAADYRKVAFFTDSQYLVNGYESARFAWPRARWLTRDGNPVANAPQWKELMRLCTRVGRPVELHWVKGHKDSMLNKLADKLAKASAKSIELRGPLDTRKVRRKKTGEKVQRGAVEMLGQELTIRLFEELDQSAQGLVRFKHEVVDKDSPYHGKVDYIWAERGTPLRAGHNYRVRVNDDTRAPRIVEVLAEVEHEKTPAKPQAASP